MPKERPIEVSEGSETSLVAHFGFGAMCNPVSRRRRGVNTMNTRPAVLYGFKFVFNGGFGDIVPKEGCEVHGVLMDMTQKDWKVIQSIGTFLLMLKLPRCPRSVAMLYLSSSDMNRFVSNAYTSCLFYCLIAPQRECISPLCFRFIPTERTSNLNGAIM